MELTSEQATSINISAYRLGLRLSGSEEVNAPIVAAVERLQSPEALGGEVFSEVLAGEPSLAFLSDFFSDADSDSEVSLFVAFPA